MASIPPKISQIRTAAELEYYFRDFVRETSNPISLIAFTAGGMVFQTAKLGMLSKLLGKSAGIVTRGSVAELLASGIALGAEVPTFVLASRVGHQSLGLKQDWSGRALFNETLATGMTLFCLKSSGALAAKIFDHVQSISLLNPQQLDPFTKISRIAIPQVATLGGILAAQQLEVAAGLRTLDPHSTPLLEGLMTLLNMHASGLIADRVLGPGHQKWRSEMTHRLTTYQRPTWSLPKLNFGVEAKLAFAVESFSERLAAPLLMEQGDGASVPKEGRLLTFPQAKGKGPAKKDVSQEATPRAEQFDPVKINAELTRCDSASQSLYPNLTAFIENFDSLVQVYMVHVDRGRAGNIELNAMAQRIHAVVQDFSNQHLRINEEMPRIEQLAFLAGSDLKLRRRAIEVRERTTQFLKDIKGLTPHLTKILAAVDRADAEGLKKILISFYQELPLAVQKSINTALIPAKEDNQTIFNEKLDGLLLGAMIKEVYRFSPSELARIRKIEFNFEALPTRGSAVTDAQDIGEIFRSLQSFDAERNYFDAIIESKRPDPSYSEKIVNFLPREVLHSGGTYYKPFEIWLRAALPALMAVERGKRAVLLEKLSSVELFMDDETREATRTVSWWIEKALTAPGEPIDWARDYLYLPLAHRDVTSTEMTRHILELLDPKNPQSPALSIMKRKGSLASFPQALFAFLRHPYDAQQALETALQAAPSLREDAVSLTGALLGAFNGRGIFNPQWLDRGVVQMGAPIDKLNFLRGGEHGPRLLYADLRVLWASGYGQGKSKPFRVLDVKKETFVHPAWKSFQRGFQEKYSRAILEINSVYFSLDIHRALESAVRSTDWHHLSGMLYDAFYKTEAMLSDLQSYTEISQQRLKKIARDFPADPKHWETINALKQRLADANVVLGEMHAILEQTISRAKVGKRPIALTDKNRAKLFELNAKLARLLELSGEEKAFLQNKKSVS